jgi:hypothetical protein
VARPSLGNLVTNFRTYEAPLPTKLRLALANNLTKIRSRSNCCGNRGQPGC